MSHECGVSHYGTHIHVVVDTTVHNCVCIHVDVHHGRAQPATQQHKTGSFKVQRSHYKVQ